MARSIVSPRGRVGQILPSGIVTDDSTKLFFQAIVDRGELVSFADFENREGIFGAVHRSFKFGILIVAGAPRTISSADFVFFATRVQHLSEGERRFSLTPAEIALLNPATKTCPIFRTRRDAELTKAIYRRFPVLASSGWRFDLRRLLNSSDDSPSFKEASGPGLLPLYEAKYFHQFDHRWATFNGDADRELTVAERMNPQCFVRPRYWYPESDISSRFCSTWKHSWAVACRDIARSTDERTFIASVVPSLAIPNTAKVVFLANDQIPLTPCLITNFASIVFDFVARQKIGGIHMSGFIVEQLPVVPPHTYDAAAPWEPTLSLQGWLLPRLLELVYTAWDLEPFARDVSYDGPPFRWHPDRRFLLRAELDAAFFQIYGLSRDDTCYVLDTFPIVRKNDEKTYSEYRTQRVILEIYDALAEAIRSGRPYETQLDPPPADPRVAHPPDPSRKPPPRPTT